MEEGFPKVAAKEPAVLDMEPGSYFWCTCGLSAKQPFCDGSHKACGMRPMKVEIQEAGEKAFCQCKHTKTAPFCDGTHCGL
ncbi:MAG: CDGSH iron-sulfur domain-containing protein [Acidobacteria bacterium]|nr:CDGSH iron-sulfur domain-containing protein [Acidobacteriota bacterium]